MRESAGEYAFLHPTTTRRVRQNSAAFPPLALAHRMQHGLIRFPSFFLFLHVRPTLVLSSSKKRMRAPVLPPTPPPCPQSLFAPPTLLLFCFSCNSAHASSTFSCANPPCQKHLTQHTSKITCESHRPSTRAVDAAMHAQLLCSNFDFFPHLNQIAFALAA